MIHEVDPDDAALYEYVVVNNGGTLEFADMVFLVTGFRKVLGRGYQEFDYE